MRKILDSINDFMFELISEWGLLIGVSIVSLTIVLWISLVICYPKDELYKRYYQNCITNKEVTMPESFCKEYAYSKTY